jgi:cytochrome bd ubiquinol oxidase subunit I
MSALILARWQFGIVTVYHFLFVPLTIGLSALVAGMHTAWYRTGDLKYRRMTQFWGKLFLINFAMGVVTGIVQEFQFGMNWSAYSRFVGDIFGAPLAIEGLLAFFLESTFLGMWIFGWDRLPKRLHLASIWLAATGTTLSAFFILAANSWMQHPVGYSINAATGRAELHDFGAVLGNVTLWVTFPHTIAASFLTAAAFVAGISAYHLRRGRQAEVFRPSMRLALVTALVAGAAVVGTGHLQGQVMTTQQPMKMAAAEALWDTESGAGFSLFAVGDVEHGRNHVNIQVPGLLSLLATNSPGGTVQGINDVQAAEQARFGPGDYRPVIGVTYWTFRLMMGFGALSVLLALWGLWLFRRGRAPAGRRFYQLAVLGIFAPLLANSAAWIFTEMGRQPWSVYGVMTTADSVSPGVGAATVATSLIVLTLLYGALAVVEAVLMVRYARAGAPEQPAEPAGASGDQRVPAFMY